MARTALAPLFVGVDVGGTKTLALVATAAGDVLARSRHDTPVQAKPAATIDLIAKAIAKAVAGASAAARVGGIGLAIPGVVDPDAGHVVVTPNMNLTGIDAGRRIAARFHTPVALGNDVNCGTLGEKWLGSARGASSAVGVFLGTGIGGGLVLDGKLVRGAREAAAEVGHMVMQIDGPRCGCGGRGCLEALASRTAIERDIRDAIKAGRRSVVTRLLADKGDRIRSGVLKEALARKDKLVVEVLRRAGTVIGHACLTIRHLLDPEVIILGGGMMEACGDFLLPVIEKIVAHDPLPGARPGGHVLVSSLGDDAVALGAVALALQAAGRDPFAPVPDGVQPRLPKVALARGGRVLIDSDVFDRDVFVRACGEVRTRRKGDVIIDGGWDEIGLPTIQRVVAGHPAAVFIGLRPAVKRKLTRQAERFLRYRNIELHVLPMARALRAWAAYTGRKALLLCAGGGG
jgi:glucokinase